MKEILTVLLLFIIFKCSLSQKPQKLGTCKVKLADGRFINLKPLDNPNSPRVAAYNGYNYKFNPCSGITCGTVPSVSVCQVGIANPQFTFNCGDENSVEFDFISSSLVMTFKGTQAGVLRTSRVQCVCDQTGPESYSVNENPPNFYNIEFKSKCCCPSTSENGNCGSGPGPKPSKMSSCKARLSDGKIIDLSSLDNSTNPRYSYVGNFSFKFNPCSPIKCDSTMLNNSAAICQTTPDQKFNFNLGDQKSVAFDYISNLFTLSYTNSYRSSVVRCVCSKNEYFKYISEDPFYSYNFEFQSPCCCPGGCSNQPKKLSNCKAQLMDGRIIDLTSLDNPKFPRNVKVGDYTLQFNPCSPIECDPSEQESLAAICQGNPDYNFNFNLGDQSSVVFDYDVSKVFTMTYSKAFRRSIIKCICSKDESLVFNNEDPFYIYNLTFQSPCCCPDGC